MAVVSRQLKKGASPRRITPLLTVVTYIVALLAASIFVQRALAWGQYRIDDLRYGMPRSVHLSGLLRSEDTPDALSHIITLNVNGQISVLVLPGGDTTNVQALPGPYLVGADGPYAVPRPALRDITGDGVIDLVVTIREEAIVYVNESGALRLLTPDERAQLVGEAPIQ